MSNLRSAKHNAFRAYSKLWEILDWLYPPHCGGCGTNGSRWCLVCHSRIVRIENNFCPRCGQIQRSSDICSRCFTQPPVISGVRSFAVFEGPLRNALHRLKYSRDLALAEALSRYLLELFNNVNWEIDCILPVPLSRERYQQRGYNQAALLAYPLALATGLSYQPNGIKKVRDTATQVGLSFEQRHSNVSGAFYADREIVQTKKVLIIDDVMTSGATIESCASAIMRAGAVQVYGMTLAQAPDVSILRKA